MNLGLSVDADLLQDRRKDLAYLRNRIDIGDLVLPDGSLATGQFGQQAIYGID
jgi:hypothetical protein